MTAAKRVPPAGAWILVRDYDEFFASVNLLSAGLEEVDRLHRAGDREGAFAAYRRELFARLVRLDLNPLDARAVDVLSSADELLANRISLLGTGLVDIGSPIDWFATPGGDRQWQSHLGYFYFANCLVSAYRSTGSPVYLEKWMSVLDDFFAFHPVGVEGLAWSRTAPMYRNELAYGCGGEGKYPDYAGGSWLGLSCGRVLLWLSSLAALGNDPAIPDAFLANLLTSIMRDHVTVMLNNPRRYTPNQFYHVALALTSLGVILPEYRLSPACYLVGIERLETSMRTTALADGSDMEQSFNYNSGLPGRFHELLRLYEGNPTPRITALLDVVERRCRFLAAMVTPLGTWPALAKTHGDDVTATLARWAELFGLDDVGAIARGEYGGEGGRDGTVGADRAPVERLGRASISFPYGGYHVMRSGYARDDSYLFFKASRLAIGHMHEDTNSFVLFAHGRMLLTDSGNYNYADDPESQRRNSYFFSSMSHNTVTVDGLSQGRLSLQGSTDLTVLETPIEARWYDSPTLALVEGYYREGYSAPAAPPLSKSSRRLPGTHRRQVIWLKPDLWVVVDRLEIGGDAGATGGAMHRYSSHWQLSSGFAREAIEIDSRLGLVRTIDRGGANVTILCSRRVSPRVVFGSETPYEGWSATHYNEAVPSADLSFTWEEGNRASVVHLIAARADSQNPVASVEAMDGGMCVGLADGRDLTLLAPASGEQVSVRMRAAGGSSEESLLLDSSKAEGEPQGDAGRRDLHIRDGVARPIG